jgi:hypothetical protein
MSGRRPAHSSFDGYAVGDPVIFSVGSVSARERFGEIIHGE